MHFSSASLTVSKLRTQLSGEHLEALDVTHFDEVLLELRKSLNTFFLHISGGRLFQQIKLILNQKRIRYSGFGFSYSE